MNKLKKALATVMSFLTAMTMLTSIMGTTAFAENANTEINATAECAQFDGVFSEGASYRFLPESAALIIDGNGSFTEDEISALTSELKPRSVILGDNVSIPNSDEANNEWLNSALSMFSPYAVYTHKNSKTNENIKKLKNYWKTKGLDATILGYIYSANTVDDDFYTMFNYSQDVAKKGSEMEQYLIDRGIRETIARKITGYYLVGLQNRIDNISLIKKMPGLSEFAYPDGTEVNEETIEDLRKYCFDVAELEQDFIEDAEGINEIDNPTAKFLANNGVDVDTNTLIQLQCYKGSKHTLAFASYLVKWNRNDSPLISDPTRIAEVMNCNLSDADSLRTTVKDGKVFVYYKNHEILNRVKSFIDTEIEYNMFSSDIEYVFVPQNDEKAVKILLNEPSVSGDINDDGVFGVADVVTLQKALSTNSVTPDMDINGDGKVNVFDLVAAKRKLADVIGGEVKSL